MFFNTLIQSFWTMSWDELIVWAAFINLVQFGAALLIGHILVWFYREKAVAEPPEPITRAEVLYATGCVILNTGVMIAGAVLWRGGLLHVRYDLGFMGVLVDVLVLFIAMDLAMYVLHRIAHHPRLYPLIHQTHHRYENPRPLTLFVLNPFETLGFGALWLTVLMVYSASVMSIVIYLTFNLVFGMVGHLGVEPLPARWLQLPVIRFISTSTFHAEHHGDKQHNFGFYTVIWDRLFGTLSPDYTEDFNRANRA